jgi:hypothetical protein
LLDKEAKVNVLGGKYSNTLQAAAFNGGYPGAYKQAEVNEPGGEYSNTFRKLQLLTQAARNLSCYC